MRNRFVTAFVVLAIAVSAALSVSVTSAYAGSCSVINIDPASDATLNGNGYWLFNDHWQFQCGDSNFQVVGHAQGHGNGGVWATITADAPRYAPSSCCYFGGGTLHSGDFTGFSVGQGITRAQLCAAFDKWRVKYDLNFENGSPSVVVYSPPHTC